MTFRQPLVAAIWVSIAFGLLGGCAWPTKDRSKLAAIAVESRILMKVYPIGSTVPKSRWPRVIAGLEPEFVSVGTAGVHIMTKAFFDGGWGYFVPRRQGALPGPVERFEELGQSVYWWHPY